MSTYPTTNHANAERLKEAARRNRETRFAQLTRLTGAKLQAREAVADLQARKEGTKAAAKNLEVMSQLKEIPNFFPTPKWLVADMLDAVGIVPGVEPLRVLEPSAGKGDIAHMVASRGHLCTCVEMVPRLTEILFHAGLKVFERDFLETKLEDFTFAAMNGGFDRVAMNPPFERGIDERHVRHAFKMLRRGGQLVAVVCCMTGPKLQDLIDETGGTYEALPEDTFKTSERPTSVRTGLVILNK